MTRLSDPNLDNELHLTNYIVIFYIIIYLELIEIKKIYNENKIIILD